MSYSEEREEIERLKHIISEYKSDIDSLQDEQDRLRRANDGHRNTIEGIKRSASPTIPYSSCSGQTVIMPETGYNTTYTGFPFNNTINYRWPYGSDMTIKIPTVYSENHGVSLLNNDPANGQGARYSYFTIDLQQPRANYIISVGGTNDSPVVYIQNKNNLDVLKVELPIPQQGTYRGFNLRFGAAGIMGVVISNNQISSAYRISKRVYNYNHTNNPTVYITEGGYPGLHIGTNYWFAYWQRVVPKRQVGISDKQLSSTNIDLTIAPAYLSDYYNAYFYNNPAILTNALQARIKNYTDLIAKNDYIISNDEQKIKSLVIKKNKAEDELRAELREAEEREEHGNPTKVSIPPTVAAKPQVVVGNNNTINNVSNVINLNQTNNTTINSTVTNYIVNIGNTNKPESPAVQLPPPVNLASLISQLSGSNK